MIKDIVVNLSVGRSQDVAADYAVSIASAFEAHLAAVAFAYEPVIPGTIYGSLPAEFIDASRAKSTAAAQAVIARFEEAARLAGVSAESHNLDATLVGGSDMFGRIARRFDVAVVAQAVPNKAAPEDLVIEAALFASGRPVVVVPYIQKEGLKLDRVLIGWDGSRTAARALADAMPFLARAREVEMLIVTREPPRSDELPGADMGDHLARHGIKVDVKVVVTSDTDVACAILSHAADSSADFLVMGGYGHSRLREFVLGGVTRGILGAMTLPVLMSH